MLRANSKIVRQKIRQLIIDNYNDKANDVDNWYDYKVGADFNYICKWILQEFIVAEFGFTNEDIKKRLRYFKSYGQAFHEWCGGLPSAFNTDDWYLGCDSAINFLGDILEETEYERNQYDEMDALKMIDALIYNELIKGCPLTEAIEFTIENHKNRRY